MLAVRLGKRRVMGAEEKFLINFVLLSVCSRQRFYRLGRESIFFLMAAGGAGSAPSSGDRRR